MDSKPSCNLFKIKVEASLRQALKSNGRGVEINPRAKHLPSLAFVASRTSAIVDGLSGQTTEMSRAAGLPRLQFRTWIIYWLFVTAIGPERAQRQLQIGQKHAHGECALKVGLIALTCLINPYKAISFMPSCHIMALCYSSYIPRATYILTPIDFRVAFMSWLGLDTFQGSKYFNYPNGHSLLKTEASDL